MMGLDLKFARVVTGQHTSSEPYITANMPPTPNKALEHAKDYCSPEWWFEQYVPKVKTEQQLREQRIRDLEEELKQLKQSVKEDMHTLNSHVDKKTDVLNCTYTTMLEMLDKTNKTYWIQRPGQT